MSARYAAEHHFWPNIRIRPGETFQRSFGPPSPGRIQIKLQAQTNPAVGAARPADPPRTTGAPPVLGTFVASALRSGPLGGGLGGLGTDRVNPGTLDPGPSGNPLPPPVPFNTNHLRVELVRGTSVVLSSMGPLDAEVPSTPARPPHVGSATPAGAPAEWILRITNTHTTEANVVVNVVYTGYRPILEKPIDLEFINRKLDEIFNLPQPLSLTLENRVVGSRKPSSVTAPKPSVTAPRPSVTAPTSQPSGGRPRTIDHSVPEGEVPIYQTFFRIDTKDLLWAEQYGRVEESLGVHLLDATLHSDRIRVSARVIDDRLAFVLYVSFGGMPRTVYGRALAQLALDGWKEDVFERVTPDCRLTSARLEIRLILEHEHTWKTADATFPTFRVEVVPELDMDASLIGKKAGPLLGGLIQQAALQLQRLHGLVDSPALRTSLHKIAVNAMGWLLGDREAELTGAQTSIAIEHAGKVVRTGDVLVGEHAPEPVIEGGAGALAKIDHIVMLMLENRSFDHMLGYLRLPPPLGRGRSEVDGLTGQEACRNLDGSLVRPFPLTTTKFHCDPGHDFFDVLRQRGGYPADTTPPFYVEPNAGFVLDYARRLQNRYPEGVTPELEGGRREHIMGYHPQDHVPMYDFLADQFGICQRWFAAHPGQTWPNRFIAMTGGLAPGADNRPDIGNPDLGTFETLAGLTIFDHLSQAGVSWRVYEHDLCLLRLFTKYTLDDQRILPFEDPQHGFAAAAARGDLPAVTMIEPNLTDIPPGNDDHPPIDITYGQRLVHTIYTALRNSPVWEKTLFVITYDEHGGFYDHVYPDERVAALGTYMNAGSATPITWRGMRVPAFAISPWIPTRTVSSVSFDHTSLLKTIVARFMPNNPPNLGPRVRAANDLRSLLALDSPRREIPTPPVPRADGDRRGDSPAMARAAATTDRDDFHATMRNLAIRLGRVRE